VSRSWRFVLVLGAVLVLVVFVAGNPDDAGEPLAPDATGPAGAKAMVLLLDELGADVDVEAGVPDDDVDTAVLLEDRLDGPRAEGLQRWVEAGGTLVVADPRSAFTPIVLGPLGAGGPLDDTAVELDRGDCDMQDLDEVQRLDLAAGVGYELPSGSRSCFGDEESAFVVERTVGAGRLVAVGGPGPFTNDGLDRADAAVLVADLLAPEPEGTRVAFLERGAPVIAGDGEETLTDLVPEQVTLALVQLGLAFAVYVWFRARRAGRPVPEPLPTTLAGSELVDAVGRLLQQERDPERSAGLLRDDLRRGLARRFGLSPGADVDELVAAAERAGADPDRLRAVLAGPPVTDGDTLTTLARHIDTTRREILT
jgi:hypothetical protein